VSPAFRHDVATLAPTTAYRAVVQFQPGSRAAHRALIARRGLTLTGDLQSLDAVGLSGPLASVAALSRDPAVAYVEPDAPLRYFEETGHWATQVGIVHHPVSGGPYRDSSGNILDGRGVGVAIVDSGVDASHPDLVNRVVTNRVEPGIVDAPGLNSDLTSGHGTHVSGIVAGDGTSSQGTVTGVAPGSQLHVFASGLALDIVFASESLDDIYTHFDTFVPRIRVINASWGGGAAYNASGIIETLVRKLVIDKGVTYVFAAGNDGGDGTTDRTTGYCKDPTPGVVCVANYDDNESGDRDFKLDDSSSRGKAGAAFTDTYPDISAPGSFITSTFLPTSGALYGSFIIPDPAWAPFYADAGGTSMAAPHIAGIAALLYQAKPTLTPGDVEDILLDTAHKFTDGGSYIADPQNPGGTTSFDKGAGLADVVAALADPRVNIVGDNAASPAAVVTGDGGDAPGPAAADLVSATATTGLTGITFTMTVADANDRPPTGSVGLRAIGDFGGKTIRATVDLNGDGSVSLPAESPDDPTTAEASSFSRSGNTVTFFVPYAELGNPPSGSPVHDLRFATYISVIHDVAPNPTAAIAPPSAADLVIRPVFVAPFPIP
jgi:serine protease AprX